MSTAKDSYAGAAGEARRGFLGSVGVAVAAAVAILGGNRLAAASGVDRSSEAAALGGASRPTADYRSLLATVQEMQAREAIKELRALYCWHATRADAQRFGELFTADCTFEYQVEGQRRWFKGRRAVSDIVATITPGTVTPVVSNHIIQIAGDEAHGTCAMRNTILRDGVSVSEVGFYADQLRCEAGRWRFTERRWFTYSPVYEKNDVPAH